MVQDTLKGVVERMITLDVGSGGIEKSLSMTLFVATYQLFNAFCFLLGNPGGDIAQKIFLKKINYKARPHDEINVSMNYNYYYMWKILLSNFGSIQGFFLVTILLIWIHAWYTMDTQLTNLACFTAKSSLNILKVRRLQS